MSLAPSDYRENHTRSVYVTGEIDQTLVERLTPDLNRLRLSDSTPITLYIDSRGGSIRAAETIRQLAASPNPDGKCCRLITVVTGKAASAAADFLALGDYSIAYQHAQIAYHGSRSQSSVALTYEGASSLASNLQITNEFFSVRLARHAFPRFMLRLTQLNPAWDDYRNAASPGRAAFKELVSKLTSNLDSANARMVEQAHDQQVTIASLRASVAVHLGRFKETTKKSWSDAQFEAELFKAILNYKVRDRSGEDWTLTGTGLAEVTDDFNLLNDYHFGQHRRSVDRWLKTYGELFLSDVERAEYKAQHKAKPDPERIEWLKSKCESKIRSVWYLIVSICRLLQSDDYDLSPKEAYWVGLVDEVPGTDLPNLRQMAESLKPAETEPASPAPVAAEAPTSVLVQSGSAK